MRRGTAQSEWLIILIATLVTIAVLVLFYLRSSNRDEIADDVSRMRRVYVGLSLYQEDHQGTYPGNLAVTHLYIETPDLVSASDPYTDKAGPFPIEPTQPLADEYTTSRISDAYIGNYLRWGMIKGKSWQSLDVKAGILANPWHGKINKLGGVIMTGTGPIYRIVGDGSLVVLPQRRHPDMMGDPGDLFLTPP